LARIENRQGQGICTNARQGGHHQCVWGQVIASGGVSS